MRGLRRMARRFEASNPADPSSVAFGDTFSRKGRRENVRPFAKDRHGLEQVVANGLYLGAQYALMALGLTLIFALMNVLNFAHGQMYVLGGFVTYEIYGLLHCDGREFHVAEHLDGHQSLQL